MTHRNRYAWLIADSKPIDLIIMDESKDRRGRTVFEVPLAYREYLTLRGIEVKPATCAEAAEYLAKKLRHRERQTGIMPEDCCDWLSADLQSRGEGLAANGVRTTD